MYKIMLIVGGIGSAITFISTIILFFKCNVIEIVKDLTGIKIVKKKEVMLSPATDNGLNKIKTSMSKSTSTSRGKSNNKDKIENKDIINDTQVLYDKKTEIADSKSDLEYSKVKALEEANGLKDETSLLQEETGILEEETGILEEETGILDEETNILDEETGILEEETGILEEELKDGEYVKEIDVVVINCTSIINI